jgi:hypothetical protein
VDKALLGQIRIAVRPSRMKMGISVKLEALDPIRHREHASIADCRLPIAF